MHRIILLLSIIPLLAAIILRRMNGDRILRRDGQNLLTKPAESTARKMLDAMGHEKIELRQRKSPWSVLGSSSDKEIELPDFTKGKSHPGTVESHALAALRVGIFLLGQREPSLTAKREWALRFGHVFPIFTVICVIFALAVGKLPVIWGLSIVIGSLGIAACAQALALACELRAATLTAVVLEKKRIFPRLSEEELVTTAVRAQAWRAIVPGLLARLM
jgi:hypothetical protein